MDWERPISVNRESVFKIDLLILRKYELTSLGFDIGAI